MYFYVIEVFVRINQYSVELLVNVYNLMLKGNGRMVGLNWKKQNIVKSCLNRSVSCYFSLHDSVDFASLDKLMSDFINTFALITISTFMHDVQNDKKIDYINIKPCRFESYANIWVSKLEVI